VERLAKRIHRAEGFTLIELMIVILIIGILVAIAVPVFLAATSNAKTKACKSNQRSWLSACDIYAADNGVYPSEAEWAATGTAYYENSEGGNTPLCPNTVNTITLTYSTTGDDRPTSSCPEHGSPTDQ
jgi:type IV pilus assembly protein PilA